MTQNIYTYAYVHTLASKCSEKYNFEINNISPN